MPRGISFDDQLPGDSTIVRGPLTRETVRQLAAQGVSGVKADASTPANTLACLTDLPTLRRLDLSDRADLVNHDLAFLDAMPWLTAISLSGCRAIDDDGIAYLRRHERLEEVYLRWTATGDETIGTLAGNPNLQRIVTGAQLTDRGAALLREFPALRNPGALEAFVSISSSTLLTDRGLTAVADLAGVRALDVHCSVFGSSHYTVRGVAQLQRMTTLEELNFRGDLTNDAVLREIAAIPRLRLLMCQDMLAEEEGLIALGASKTLESLWGRHCHRVTNRGFAALARLPRLRKLGLGGRELTDEAMAALVDAPALTDLQPIMFGNEAFRFIARMPRLETLTNMYNRDTDDAATRHLQGHPRLVHYGAHGTQITDASLHVIADLPALESAEFESCDRITDDGLRELARASRLRRVSVGSCIGVNGSWMESMRPLDLHFDPADRRYVDQYRFWTLLDYPNLPVTNMAEPLEHDFYQRQMIVEAVLLGCRAEPREDGDGVRLTVESGDTRARRVGLMTAMAFAAPVRIDVVVDAIADVRLCFAHVQMIFDASGRLEIATPSPTMLDPRRGQAHQAADATPSGRWTRIALEIDLEECRLLIDGDLRHRWRDNFAGWRSRIAVAPRRSTVTLRELWLTPL